MVVTYEMAFTEVLILLKNYLSLSEFNKIPKEVIDLLEKYRDKNYIFEIDKNIPLNKQKISEKANAIIIMLYRDFLTNEHQKLVLKQILDLNSKKKKQEPKEIIKNYNILFKKRKSNAMSYDLIHTKEVSLTEIKKEKWYKKILVFFKNIIKV